MSLLFILLAWDWNLWLILSGFIIAFGCAGMVLIYWILTIFSEHANEKEKIFTGDRFIKIFITLIAVILLSVTFAELKK